MRLNHLRASKLWAQATLEMGLGITFIEDDEPGLAASMPVGPNTRQVFGLLHGGASAALVESLGSVASLASLDLAKERAVGLDLQINHLRGVTSGSVVGRATAVRLGRRVHVWQVDIHDEKGQLTASGRLTVLVSAVPPTP